MFGVAEKMDDLATCIKSTRKHLKLLESAAAAHGSAEDISDSDVAQLVARSLAYHRKQYDAWMQVKVDRFADVSWQALGVVDVPSSEVSRTPSANGELKVSARDERSSDISCAMRWHAKRRTSRVAGSSNSKALWMVLYESVSCAPSVCPRLAAAAARWSVACRPVPAFSRQILGGAHLGRWYIAC